jgi:hypothetical protein
MYKKKRFDTILRELSPSLDCTQQCSWHHCPLYSTNFTCHIACSPVKKIPSLYNTAALKRAYA